MLRRGIPSSQLALTVALAIVGLFASEIAAFQPVPLPHNHPSTATSTNSKRPGSFLETQRAIDTRIASQKRQQQQQSDEDHPKDDDQDVIPVKRPSRFQRIRARVKKVARRKAAVALFAAGAVTGGFWQVFTPPRADASAPVMAIPKAESRDPATEALLNHERQMIKKAQAELQAMNQKAREIQAKHGEAARDKFEKEYKQQQEAEAREKAEGLEKLKRDLLDQGIDPFVDYEGKRQVTLYEKGIDLGAISGTQLNLEKELERTNYKKSMAFKTEANRRVIKCMVQDMKNRGVDPLQYFAEHQTKTEQVLQLPAAQAAQLAQKYEANLQEYGQISVPKEGEMSALEKMKKQDGGKGAKEEAKRAKAEAKAKVVAEKKAAKEAAKKEKEASKAATKKEKEEAKKAKQAAKAAAAATAAAGSAAAAAASSVGSAGVDTVKSALPSSEAAIEGSMTNEESADFFDSDQDDDGIAAASQDMTSSKTSKKAQVGDRKIPIIPIAGTVVAVGGGGYALKIMQERSAASEEERQRQFRLLMGFDEDEDEDDIDGDNGILSTPKAEKPKPKKVEPIAPQDSAPAPEPAPEPAPVKKKRKVGGFFAKKSKNDRETDLNNLVSGDATAPEFATLLAKILTYGAPGRFPEVKTLPGSMPFSKEFDVEEANKMLVDAREEAGISMEESAEVFANVVNAMLIDIVDLASSALKEKDDKILVDAINVVVDFMNHAASLYDSVAEGITINPVTYGGTLGAKSLEQMYSSYAVSGMLSSMGGDIESDFDSRVGLLKDVFQISDKKADGLMMKAMQKNMMKMMKTGEGMEGMAEMMKGMGDMDGMGVPGMPGEDMSPEQLKEMLMGLKQMKDEGSIPPEEFETVKKQFREAFGSSIDDVIQQGKEAGEEMTEEERELLDLMKSILD